MNPISSSAIQLEVGADPLQAPIADNAAYRKKAETAAVQFESFFIQDMLKQMRKATREISSEDSIFKNTINSDMLDFADQAVSQELAKQRVFGVANAIMAQLMPQSAQYVNIPLNKNANGVALEQSALPSTGAFSIPPFIPK
ncbi:rod-binding protein [Iodobacter arcticus]|uniref:Rod-binding protein n=1 Tax=Iodobacter arcticus TaxID=590593 RepID=A0ABW2QTN3_9NEIS